MQTLRERCGAAPCMFCSKTPRCCLSEPATNSGNMTLLAIAGCGMTLPERLPLNVCDKQRTGAGRIQPHSDFAKRARNRAGSLFTLVDRRRYLPRVFSLAGRMEGLPCSCLQQLHPGAECHHFASHIMRSFCDCRSTGHAKTSLQERLPLGVQPSGRGGPRVARGRRGALQRGTGCGRFHLPGSGKTPAPMRGRISFARGDIRNFRRRGISQKNLA